MSNKYPQTQAIVLQQGGSTWELYVHCPDDPEEHIKDCEEHTYTAVEAGEIEIVGKDDKGRELVTLGAALQMAENVLTAAREIIAGY